MSTHGLLFVSKHYKNPTKHVGLNVCVQRTLLFYSGVIKMISMYACFKSVQPSRVKQFLDFMPLPKYDFLLHHFFVLELRPLIYLARNQENVYEWGNMSTHGLLFVSKHYKNPTKHVGLVKSGPHHLIEN
jgi:hypothetical protein